MSDGKDCVCLHSQCGEGHLVMQGLVGWLMKRFFSSSVLTLGEQQVRQGGRARRFTPVTGGSVAWGPAVRGGSHALRQRHVLGYDIMSGQYVAVTVEMVLWCKERFYACVITSFATCVFCAALLTKVSFPVNYVVINPVTTRKHFCIYLAYYLLIFVQPQKFMWELK